MEHTLFVYGSLKRGLHNHYMLKGARFIGTDRTYGEMYDIGGIPAVLPHGQGLISGELYAVGPVRLAVLDRIEGHPNWYERCETTLVSGRKAFIYYYRGRVRRNPRWLVPNGNWTRQRSRLF